MPDTKWILQTRFEEFLLELLSQDPKISQIGLSICVHYNDSIDYKHSFGLRNKELNTAVNNETIFLASSLAKGFTSAAFLLKTQTDSFFLKEPICKYTKKLFFNDKKVSQIVNFLDILSHQVGLPSHDLLWMLGSYDTEDLCRRIKYLQIPTNSFRKEFCYNNLLYSTLGIVFEEIYKTNLCSYITDNIFKPLQMEHSFFYSKDLMNIQNIALPYFNNHLLKIRNMDNIATAGGLCTNIIDLSKWLKVLLNNQESSNFFSKKLLEEMSTAQISFRGPLPLILNGLEWVADDLSYGLGWFVGTAFGKKIIFHPGLIDGYTSLILLIPELDFGIGILTNENLSSSPGVITYEILKFLMQSKDNKVVLESTRASVVVSENKNISAQYNFIIEGQYFDMAYGEIEILKEEANYFLIYKKNKWLLEDISGSNATIYISIMGLRFPLSIRFNVETDKVADVEIPFSLDSRVKPQVFKKI